MPVSEERFKAIFEQVENGESYNMLPAPLEQTILKEGDLCICNLFGLDPNSNAKNLSELDQGARFQTAEQSFDVMIYDINERGWPTYIMLMKHKNLKTNEFTDISPAPICKVDSWMDICEMNMDGFKVAQAAFMTIIPDNRTESGMSAGALVLKRCIRAKDEES